MIDKVRLRVPFSSFSVGSDAPLLVAGATKQHATGDELYNFELYKTKSGNIVRGSKAFYNSPLYSLDINAKGLSLEFNPAKVCFGENIKAVNREQLIDACSQVKEDLSLNDISLDLNRAYLTRLDLQKTVQTEQPCSAYERVLGMLSPAHSTTAKYKGYTRFGNRQWQAVFYDKVAELQDRKVKPESVGLSPDEKLFRCEMRLMSKKSVNKRLEIDELEHLLRPEIFSTLESRYKLFLRERVFKDKQLKSDLLFASEIEKLKYFKQLKDAGVIKRGVLGHYLQSIAPEYISAAYGSIDNFKAVLQDLGFERTTVFRNVRKVENALKLNRHFREKYAKRDSVSSLYSELYHKLAA